MKTFFKLLVIVLLIPTLLSQQVLAKTPSSQTVVTLGKTEVVNKDYFAAGDTVIVSGTVNGDAYIAGGTIIIDGTINGDLLAAGGTIQIRGPVKNNIRAASGTITINSRVGGNVTLGGGNVALGEAATIGGSVVAGAGNLEISAPIGKGMTIGGGNILIGNTVNGDIVAGAQQLTLLRNASVKGNVSYWSNDDAQIITGATVAGTLDKHILPKTDWQAQKTATQRVRAKAAFGITFFGSIATILTFFILGLICIKLFPAFTTHTIDRIQEKPWGSFGTGLVAVIVLPIIAIILLFTLIGIPISLFIFFMLGVLYVMSDLVASMFVGVRVLSWLKVKPHRAWQLLTGLVLLTLVLFIPIIGWIIKTVLILMATGAILTEKRVVYQEMRSKNLV